MYADAPAAGADPGVLDPAFSNDLHELLGLADALEAVELGPTGPSGGESVAGGGGGVSAARTAAGGVAASKARAHARTRDRARRDMAWA